MYVWKDDDYIRGPWWLVIPCALQVTTWLRDGVTSVRHSETLSNLTDNSSLHGDMVNDLISEVSSRSQTLKAKILPPLSLLGDVYKWINGSSFSCSHLKYFSSRIGPKSLPSNERYRTINFQDKDLLEHIWQPFTRPLLNVSTTNERTDETPFAENCQLASRLNQGASNSRPTVCH